MSYSDSCLNTVRIIPNIFIDLKMRMGSRGVALGNDADLSVPEAVDWPALVALTNIRNCRD